MSGYLDDTRVPVDPAHRLYGMASYAYAYEELWTDEEHRAYWRAHLALWPGPSGRKTNRESLAYAIVQAERCGVPASAVPELLGYSHDDLRDRNVLDLAQHMRAELENPRLIRVPRVMTNEELDSRPLLPGHQTLSAHEAASQVLTGTDAIQAVLRSAAATSSWRRDHS